MNHFHRLFANVAAAASAFAPLIAQAQNWPSSPIRWIVPFPPGGSADVMSRTLGTPLSSSLGQQIIIENRAGASGTIGIDLVAKSTPDGYTVALGAPGSLTINVHVSKLPFDPLKDLQPIAGLAVVPVVIVAGPGQPIRNMADLVREAKANPGKLSFGTTGVGSSMHLAGELLKGLAGFDMVHIPYKGSAPAAADLAGGQLPLAIVDLTSALPFQRSGKLRIIALTGANRTTSAPELTTVAEQGYPGFDAAGWFALMGPARMPGEVVSRFNAAVIAALKLPDVIERVIAAGLEPAPRSAVDIDRLIRAEHAKWGKVIRDAGLKF